MNKKLKKEEEIQKLLVKVNEMEEYLETLKKEKSNDLDSENQ